MNKTEQKLVERATKALAKGRLQSGVQGDSALMAALLALVERLDRERDEYLQRWLRSV